MADLGGKVAMTYPTIHPSISQIGPQTAEKKHLLHSSGTPRWPVWVPPGGKLAMAYPTIQPRIGQIGLQATVKKHLLPSSGAPGGRFGRHLMAM